MFLINNFMSKFNTILSNHLESTELMKIRIKFDPAAESNYSEDYVGYVLQENMGSVLALVPDLSSEPMEISDGDYSPCMDTPSTLLDAFKEHAVKYMVERGYHDELKRIMKYILSAKKAVDIESVLCKCGCNDPDMLLDVYRGMVDS